ncbi:MAG TPA: NrfD/PsrC family molybdoenzyme membrane anchor subunit [Rhodanobacteraceae bacterium]
MSAAIRPGSLPPVIAPGEDATSISTNISYITLQRPFGWLWLSGLSLAFLLSGLLTVGICWLLYAGVGIWGLNIPVAWSFAIANYVWWIAIGMGGTFISGAMYIARQKWRNSINRFAEAMTVFAVSVSGIFPILHLGRPWFFYWLFPYPDVMNLWPQWRSSLEWDFWAILAYLVVSIVWWYVGMLPDLATLRDRAPTIARARFYGLLALGWRGEARHWMRFEKLNLITAALAVVLVFSVHSMVALDFSEGLVPGWHETIFPPFFVAGALFSGFAMVLTLAIPLRKWFHLHAYLTERHIENIAKLMLAAGLFVDYSYFSEIYTAFFSMDRYDVAMTWHRIFGAYAWVFWGTILFNVAQIQLLWIKRVRRSATAVFVIAVGVLVGMWLERFMLIVSSLYEDFVPSAWGMFWPTFWDLAFLAGSVGLFYFMFLLFVRLLPVLSMFELRKLAQSAGRVEVGRVLTRRGAGLDPPDGTTS